MAVLLTALEAHHGLAVAPRVRATLLAAVHYLGRRLPVPLRRITPARCGA